MPSSSSSSSVEIIGSSSPRSRFVSSIHVRARSTTVDESDTDDDRGSAALSGPVAERYTSSYRSQESLDALCRKYGVPREFAARPAGDRRACSAPPPGAVCVYAHALEAGMRVPLHAFFCEVLGHFGIAPSQLAPNGWRIMVGFVVLCHFAGVRPSVAVFRYFFSLSVFRLKGWYCFRCKDAVGVLFTGLPSSINGWKERFFFLSSPAPWPCPVEWGEQSKSSTTEPVLTSEEKKSAGKLLRAHGAAAVDLRTYLCESNLAAAFSSNLTGASPLPHPPSPRTTGAKGMDPSVYDTMKSIRAEKAAAQAQAAAAAAAEKVKTEPGSNRPGWSPLSGKKRKLEEDNAKEGMSRSELNTPPAAHGVSVSGAGSPPGFSAQKASESDQDRKPRYVPDRHDGDSADWETARQLLQGFVTPSRERTFTAAKPSDVVASSYITMLQAANYASFSFGYALELEEKLRTRERDAAAEVGALREELERVKAELADAKEAAAAEVKSAKAAAVHEFLGSTEHVRRLAEHALEGYERGMEHMKLVALRRYPYLDAARLVVPPGGPPVG